ncbi:NAD(P)-dependent dehydrogenase (short-subunit alcohol dehydrogenase family) [Pseudomonas citronellolis]|uniref:oxidoreductase n=1 Tax=Pseudomonas citronellolis TaxID=53408 RepID=UPI00209C7BEC|nr:oxidoreductase [Pseudomonas citronellolis]MCP1644896.1 NAD(P)-dependent dehydrogenase (short-subunit alcohol dehydrogenase family) [Pseudomonas citronellolis]MCP1667841.1 NAD(P)-dependent dehydrogenase (short-subunit alcohol dehydrogenase family) [Pseudomonas citronellolis]MCP1699063.1 NAD(P)-dependent dehydrogenase (short-subunit alcohol dehydrogenase family) [Pseudomonas citronellolis]MCP1704948.1 NAD(P)-dependent dehydrogenase (short-subunit alcohol dehydrogenase family) [Pseudomonas citr
MSTPQSPIGSGFGAASTAEEVIRGIDLTGKYAVVTGGYSGIGIETVKALRSAGAKVFVPARDLVKAQAALKEMPDVIVQPMDLLDPSAIDRFAEYVLGATETVDILVNNAGVMAPPLMRDGRGYESQFSANHLGHFHLTCRLWPALVRSGHARVVALSSFGHRRAGIDFHDPNFAHRKYEPWVAYGQSKTANALFAVALDSIGKRSGVRAFSVHPGGIVTDLVRHMSSEQLEASNVIDKDGRPIIDPENNKKTSQQGAATSVWCATSPRLDGMGGVYCADCDIAHALPSDESTELHGVRPRAIDPIAAGRLWQLSEQLTGTRID